MGYVSGTESKLKILFIFRERGREGEKHQCVVASHVPPTGDLAHNPGMCPDWESNWQLFDSQASTQSTELDQPGLFVIFLTHALEYAFGGNISFQYS